MKLLKNTFLFITLGLGGLMGAAYCQAGLTNVWIGPGNGSNNWSSAANWSLGAVPGPGDCVVFTNAGTSTTVSNVNNAVDEGFAGTIGTLRYENTNGAHTTLISPGKTLLVTGGLIADLKTADAGTTNTITGSGGTLIISNSSQDLVVHDVFRTRPYGSFDDINHNTLDLSGLDTFSATVSRVLTADGAGTNDAGGTLLLAKTNTIIASGDPGILVAGGGTHVGYNGSINYSTGGLVLGQMNSVFSDTIVFGNGRSSSLLTFNPHFSNSVVRFRGRDGVSRMNAFIIGNGVSGLDGFPSSAYSYSALDFSPGTVDLQANTLLVGSVPTNGIFFSTMRAKGLLSFNKGTINVNTLYVGINLCTTSSPANYAYAVGTVNVLGTGELVVNTALELGNRTNSPSRSRQTSGTLNISGGTVMAARINAAFDSTGNTITITNGTLVISNTAGPGITSLSMNDSLLQIPARGDPSVFVTNLLTGGSSNIINIGSLPFLNSFPTQLALISYSGSIGGNGFNFQLGSMPSGSQAYPGYLTNNTANASVDLVLSTYEASPPSLAAQTVNGQFQPVLSGDPGRAVDIFVSSNLMDWSWLTRMTNTSGNVEFADPMTSEAQRFYRARQNP